MFFAGNPIASFIWYSISPQCYLLSFYYSGVMPLTDLQSAWPTEATISNFLFMLTAFLSMITCLLNGHSALAIAVAGYNVIAALAFWHIKNTRKKVMEHTTAAR
jgi:hypothetical protein